MTSEDPEKVVARIRDEVSVLSGQLEALAADLRVLSDSLSAQQSRSAHQGSGVRASVEQRESGSRQAAPEVDRRWDSVTPVPAPAPTPSAEQAPPQTVRVPEWRHLGPKQQRLPEFFAIAGSAVTLIGVALVLMLPLGEDAFLSPIARTAIGLGLAAAAVAAAVWQHRTDPENVGAQALLGTGVASTFLCVLALTVRFTDPEGRPLVSVVPGLVMAGLVGVGGLWLARSWRSQWLAILAVLGSLLLGPWVGADDAENSLRVITFMTVMTLGSGPVQRGLGWAGLVVARTAPTALFFSWAAVAPSGLRSGSGLPVPLSTTIPVLLAAVLALGSLALAVLHQSGSRQERVVGAVAMAALAAPLMIVVWEPEARGPAAVACLVVGAAFTASLAFPDRIAPVVRAAAAPLGAVFLVFGVLIAADRHFQGYLYWGLAVACLAVAARSRSRSVLIVGSVLAAIGLLRWLELLLVLFDTSHVRGFAAVGVERLVESLLGVVVTALAFRAFQALFPARRALALYLAWSSAVVIGSVAVVLTGSLLGLARGDTTRGFQVAHVVVTITLTALCIVLLSRGLHGDRDRRAAVRIAIGLAATAVVKLFLFDTQTLPGLGRALAFIAVGIMLLVVGTWYYRQLEHVRPRTGLQPEEPPGSATEARGAPDA